MQVYECLTGQRIANNKPQPTGMCVRVDGFDSDVPLNSSGFSMVNYAGGTREHRLLQVYVLWSSVYFLRIRA